MFSGILQPTHLILILVIALIIVGPGKLANLGGALGKSVKEFRDSVRPGEGEEEAAAAKTDAHSEAKKTDA